MSKHIIRFIEIAMIVVLFFGIFFMLTKCNHVSQTAIKQAKVAVLQKAQVDLGEDCNVVFEKFELKSKTCLIGCVNSKNTHAVMYTAKQNELTKTWIVNIFSERKGSNAASLFSVNHSIIKY